MPVATDEHGTAERVRLKINKIRAMQEQVAMKSFACGDVVPGCDARWVCSSEDEVLAAVALHAKHAHGLSTIPDSLVLAVRGAIVTV